MIKYFCDRCGKECDKDAMTIQRFAYDGLGATITWIRNDHLCKECIDKFLTVKDKLKHDDDIFNLSDEDIELLCYTFKVGDKVITNDGRTGTIRSICYCDRCKERGFYEPKVVTDDDMDPIWITDTDKDDGFKSFYQIGDRVFGNINEESVNKELEEIGERYNKLVKQQSVIYYLKTKKESTNEI